MFYQSCERLIHQGQKDPTITRFFQECKVIKSCEIFCLKNEKVLVSDVLKFSSTTLNRMKKKIHLSLLPDIIY